MSRLFRFVALVALFLFVHLRVAEALHQLRAGHVEAHCAFCQVIHHAPAVGQSVPVPPPSLCFSRIAAALATPVAPLFVPAPRGRSPPAA